jgi:hypothetical protein
MSITETIGCVHMELEGADPAVLLFLIEHGALLFIPIVRHSLQ